MMADGHCVVEVCEVLGWKLGRRIFPMPFNVPPVKTRSLCCVGDRSICVEDMLRLGTSNRTWMYSQCIHAGGAWLCPGQL